jgi:hypothetical protein
VSTEKADQFLKDVGAYFYIETSAKNGTNIDLVFIVNNEVILKSSEDYAQEIYVEWVIS